jgi:hypothetical protein
VLVITARPYRDQAAPQAAHLTPRRTSASFALPAVLLDEGFDVRSVADDVQSCFPRAARFLSIGIGAKVVIGFLDNSKTENALRFCNTRMTSTR